MNTVLEKIKKMGIVPVVVIENEKDAVSLADALCNGGLACAEVTFRTAAAGEAIHLMKEAHPEMLVGAGTVLTVEQVDRAVQAGAEFIVSPGFDPEIVDYCIEKKIPVLPGCITPSEAARAVRRGLSVIKFFSHFIILLYSLRFLRLLWSASQFRQTCLLRSVCLLPSSFLHRQKYDRIPDISLHSPD